MGEASGWPWFSDSPGGQGSTNQKPREDTLLCSWGVLMEYVGDGSPRISRGMSRAGGRLRDAVAEWGSPWRKRGWKGPEGASLDVRSRTLRLHTLLGFSSRRQGPEVSGSRVESPACTSGVTAAQAQPAPRLPLPHPPAHSPACSLGSLTRPGLGPRPHSRLPGGSDLWPPGSSPGSAACEGPAQRLELAQSPPPWIHKHAYTHTLSASLLEAGHALSDPRACLH